MSDLSIGKNGVLTDDTADISVGQCTESKGVRGDVEDRMEVIHVNGTYLDLLRIHTDLTSHFARWHSRIKSPKCRITLDY